MQPIKATTLQNLHKYTIYSAVYIYLNAVVRVYIRVHFICGFIDCNFG